MASKRWTGSAFVLMLTLLCGSLIIGTLDGPAQRVLWPLVVCLVTVGCFALLVLTGRAGAQLDEIGIWYVGAVATYTLLPSLTYLALGQKYTPLNDSRLFLIQPTPEDVSRVTWLYVVYLVGFVAAYASARPRSDAPGVTRLQVRTSAATAIIGLWLTAHVFITVPTLLFQLTGDSYAGSYLAMQQLPLLARQAFKFLDGASAVLNILLLIMLFSNYRRWRWLILALVIWQFAITVLAAGSRTELMVTAAACASLYHLFVRPVRLRPAIFGGVVGVLLFLALGVTRTLRGLEETGPFSVGVSAGEFESLFANAIDLQGRRERAELRPSATVALSDLAGPIPSQMLPFEKQDNADWYVSTFYPEIAERGGGMAFGAVSQAVAGFGISEAVIRGALTGLLFAALLRYYRRRRNMLWAIAFNVWMIALAYQSFRATTFFVVTPFVQVFLPTVLLVEGCALVVSVAALKPRETLTQPVTAGS